MSRTSEPAALAEAGPLAGIRALDFSRVVAGPLCGRMMADQGATVIKVEPPQRDEARTAPPLIDGFSAYFTHLNAGKKGICVDLEDADVRTLLLSLVDGADVLIENFRPGTLARFGLGADALLERNPRLIYCSISGYGQRGSWASRRAYAPVVHGESGMIASNARLHAAPARPEALSHADFQAGFIAMGAIATALFARERTGRGRHLDVSLAEASVYANEFSAPELSGQQGAATYAGAASVVLTLADGTQVVTQGNPTDTFRKWAGAMDCPELLEDPRFARYPARQQHREDLCQIILDWALGIESFEALHVCVDPHRLAVGIVRSVCELAETDWAAERELLAEPIAGLRFARLPYRSSTDAIGARTRGPIRGEHNRQVLGQLEGVSEAMLDAMESKGAICCAKDGRS
ncbi:MAG: CoA transferase [bacterium]|nr:CoA transferase [bacterium]